MRCKLTAAVVENTHPAERVQELYDTELPGLCLRIESAGTKTFFLTYHMPDDPRRRRYKLGRFPELKAAQARTMALDLRARIVQGDNPAADRKDARADVTLREFIVERYATWAADHLKSHKNAVERILSGFAPLLNKKLSTLNLWAFEKHRSFRMKTPLEGRLKAAEPSTINRDFGALRSALSRAVQWGVLASNPLRDIKLFKEDKRAVVRFLDAEEEARLMLALDKREEEIKQKRERFNAWRQERGYGAFQDLRMCAFADHMKPMILLSMNTGLRRGEMFSLLWSDVTLDGPVPSLAIRGTTTKTSKTRHVPLNETARKTLAGWKAQTNPTGLVFQSPKTGARLDNCNKAWHEILRDAGLFGSFRWHDMRHHFASRLVQRGVDLNTVRELLGHADLKMTLRYAHLAPQNMSAAVALLDKKTDNVLCFPSAAGIERD